MEEVKFCRQTLHVKAKIDSQQELERLVRPVIDFANQHGIALQVGHNAEGKLISSCLVEGRTSAYCKGVVAEVRQLLQDALMCKTEVLMHAW